MELGQLLQLKKEKEAQIASIRQQLQHIKVTVPEMTEDEKDALEEQRLRAGAEAYMDYDPNTAYAWLQQAENLKAKRELAAATLEDKQRKELEAKDINSIENVKQIAIQYRANMLQRNNPNWLNFPKETRDQVEADMKGQRSQLSKTELGRALIGEVDSETSNGSATDNAGDVDGVRNDITDLDGKIKSAVDKTGPDGIPDGIADNAVEIEQALKKLELKYSANDPDLGALKAAWGSVQNILSTGKAQRKEREETAYERGMKERAESVQSTTINAKRANQVYSDLFRSPNDKSVKADVLDVLLRGESGAAISISDQISRLSTLLDSGAKAEFDREVSGPIAILSQKFGGDEAFLNHLRAKYSDKIIANKAYASLKTRAGSYFTDPSKKGGATKKDPLGIR